VLQKDLEVKLTLLHYFGLLTFIILIGVAFGALAMWIEDRMITRGSHRPPRPVPTRRKE
jgi:hypothetical protein